MLNSEEQMKKFPEDGGKVEALEDDAELMDKVSGGAATIQTCVEKLKKFGVQVPAGEVASIKDVVDKVLKNLPKNPGEAAKIKDAVDKVLKTLPEKHG